MFVNNIFLIASLASSAVAFNVAFHGTLLSKGHNHISPLFMTESDGMENNSNNEDENLDDINEHQGSHSRPSIVPLDIQSTKERNIMLKSKSLTLLTLLRGDNLFFGTSIKLHRCIIAAQFI